MADEFANQICPVAAVNCTAGSWTTDTNTITKIINLDYSLLADLVSFTSLPSPVLASTAIGVLFRESLPTKTCV